MNVATAVKEMALNADFFNEKSPLKEYQPKLMNVLLGRSTDRPQPIGLTPLSFDRKLTLQADTGADANAINKKTFDELFPDVELKNPHSCCRILTSNWLNLLALSDAS